MPCDDTICNPTGLNQNNPPPNGFAPTGNYYPNTNPNVFANMGWVGFVKLINSKLGLNNMLRATGADINLSQEITMPDVIDGRIDRTVYQLGPKIIEGTLNLPIVADLDEEDAGIIHCPQAGELDAAGQLLNRIWCWSTARGSQGRMLYDDTQMVIRYANHAAFLFDRVLVNTFGVTITQSDMITMDIGVIGRSRAPFVNPYLHNSQVQGAAYTTGYADIVDFLSPARVLTWNDAWVYSKSDWGCSGSSDNFLFRSGQVREFSFEINNNADRFFSLNGSLFPMDINVGKREITGTVKLMGLADKLHQRAATNQDRFTSKDCIFLSLYIGRDTFNTAYDPPFETSVRNWDDGNTNDGAIWRKRFDGVIYQIEEMSLSNELYETTANWFALASDSNENYEAFAPASSCAFPAWDNSESG